MLSTKRKKYLELLFLSGLAFLLFLIYRGPINISYIKDEVAYYQIAKDFYHHKYNVLMLWPYISSLYCYILAFVFKIFGPRLIFQKFVCTAFGICSIFITYLLAKKFYGRKVAFLSSFFLAISLWHISVVTNGVGPMDPLFFILSLYLFILGCQVENQKQKLAIKSKSQYSNLQSNSTCLRADTHRQASAVTPQSAHRINTVNALQNLQSSIFNLQSVSTYFIAAGIVLGIGAHFRIYILSALFIMFLFSMFLSGFKKTLYRLTFVVIPLLVFLFPIIYWNLQNRFTTFSVYLSALSGGGFAHVSAKRALFSDIFPKMQEFIYSLWHTLAGRLSAVGFVNRNPNMPFMPLLFLGGIVETIYYAVKKKNKWDIFLLLWLLVDILVFTFWITWLEDASDDPTPHRPPRYFNIVYPMPFIIAVRFLVDAYEYLIGSFKKYFIPDNKSSLSTFPLFLIFLFFLILIFLNFRTIKKISPVTSNNILALNHILSHPDNNSFVMTNFPIGKTVFLKDISYPLGYADILQKKKIFKFPARIDPHPNSFSNIASMYPIFIYGRSPEVLRVVYSNRQGNSVKGLFSLSSLPIVNFHDFGYFDFKEDDKKYNIYYVLWDITAGDGLQSILGMHDFKIDFAQDVQLFRIKNPLLNPLKEFKYNNYSNFIIWKIPFRKKRYRNVNFDFGFRNEDGEEGSTKIGEGFIYIDWLGFGWSNAFLRSVSYDDGADGLVPTLANDFIIDVEDGKYAVSLTIRNYCTPTADIYINGEKVFLWDNSVKKCTNYQSSVTNYQTSEKVFIATAKDRKIILKFVPHPEYSNPEGSIEKPWSIISLKIEKR